MEKRTGFKEEYIAKNGEEAYKKYLKRNTDYLKRKRASPLKNENGVIYLTYDFISNNDCEDLSYIYRKRLLNLWSREQSQRGDAIVVVEQMATKNKRYKVELYAKHIDSEVQEWLKSKIESFENNA